MNLKSALCRAIVVALLTSLSVTAPVHSEDAARKIDPLDWPTWRGPEMNGISRETGLPESWDPRGDALLWKNENLGGRSTPIVMNGKLYTIVRDEPESIQEAEKVVCADAATGEILWENKFNVFLSDVPDTRVGWSSVAGDPETGHVFALGVCGYFQCIDGETGKTIWSRSLSEEYGLLSTYGGRTNFPLIHDDLVIISAVIIGWGDMAKPAHRFIAFDKRNGQPVWFEGTRLLPEDTTYSTPVLAVIDGQLQMIFGSGDGAYHALQPRTGKRIWSFYASQRGINLTPVVVGNKVVAGHSEENINDNTMGALFVIDATRTGDITEDGAIWMKKELFVGKSSPVVVDDRIYAVEDKGTLLVIDLNSGDVIGKQKIGTMGRASLLYADGKIYCGEANGRCFIFEPTEDGVKILERTRLNNEEISASPIASHGRVYLTSSDAIYCFGDADREPSADPQPERPEEADVKTDTEPAHLQLVPVEALLRPGQAQQYSARLYNSRGQFLRMAEPSELEFTLSGPGGLDDSGKYSTAREAAHTAAFITAQLGDLSGEARVRVVPDYPWSFDFSKGEVPITWVGARYRHITVDFDLWQSLRAQSERASDLYLYLMTGFINSERSTLKFDDSTPQQAWTALLRFHGLLGQVTNLETAKTEFEPALELLAKEKVVANWDWAQVDSVGVQLTVQRGPRQVDGNGVMVKITTIPKGTRSQAWMGHIDDHDYTIVADVMGVDRDGRLPDIGLIGQRYTLDLMGASQQLQIRTWPPQLRMAKTIPFEWKPDVWYTMKFRTSVEDGKAVLRGKVWPRGESEPEEWQVEAEDPIPNVIGSPGVYGNAKEAEIFYDNIRVESNN